MTSRHAASLDLDGDIHADCLNDIRTEMATTSRLKAELEDRDSRDALILRLLAWVDRGDTAESLWAAITYVKQLLRPGPPQLDPAVLRRLLAELGGDHTNQPREAA